MVRTAWASAWSQAGLSRVNHGTFVRATGKEELSFARNCQAGETELSAETAG